MGANLTFNDNDDVQLKGATDQTLIGNSGNKLLVDGSGVTQPVSATSLPLPTGASTSALQTTGNTSTASIDTKTPALVSGRVPVDGSGVTQPISATALPLPTGAATSALQTSGNTSLSSIDTKTPALVTGRVPVDGSGVTQPISATSLPLPTGASTETTLGTRLADATFTARINTLGQKTSANSTPVVLSSDQSSLLTSDIINVAGQYRAQSVTTTAAEALGASTILASRKSLTITPTNGIIYWGYSNSVTSTTGTPIFKNQTLAFAVGPSVHIYLISAGTIDCRITEGS